MPSSSRRQVADGTLILLTLILLVPPLGNVFYREFSLARANEEESVTEELVTLKRTVAIYEQELRAREQRNKVLSIYEAYSPRMARVLPLQDAMALRHSFWIAAVDRIPLARDMAVVSQDGALIGRIVRTGTPSLAKVQSAPDRGFTVRFRYREARGFLRGSGRIDPATDRPLLDVVFLDVDVDLKEGDYVFTDGGDGIYPRGIVIGELVRAPQNHPAGGFQVMGAVSLRIDRDVVVLVDRHVEQIGQLGRLEGRF